jgi:SAM-dependent methyltransferase
VVRHGVEQGPALNDDEAHRQRYSKAIRDARDAGGDSFQSWFNRADSEEAAFRQGFWDFAFHILTRPVYEHIEGPGALTALEIGCGGGRLLNAAAEFFGHAIGIDVHGELDAVGEMLAARGRTNVTLLQTDGTRIPVDDASVDFVYSFIVLQHLPRFDALVRYVEETHRVLRPGGVAQLYYAKLHSHDPRRRYREIDAPVNHVSLAVAPRELKRLARAAGFTVVATGGSVKRAPDGHPDKPGGQVHATLLKAPHS